jgi:predicted secreted hydrolase
MHRRSFLLSWVGAFSAGAPSAANLAPRRLVFPADFGAHPQQRIEWWYLTGQLWASDAPASRDTTAQPQFGFQVTFFRSRTQVDPAHPSRFAARQLLFAHVALTDLEQRRMRHDQRIARTGFARAGFDPADTNLTLHDWNLARSGPAHVSRYAAQVRSPAAAFGLRLQCEATQPVLVQGENGWSRKGPNAEQASLYYSQPQLSVNGNLQLDAREIAVQGRAWLDHEWADALLDPQAVGWDWIGMNLHDGSALTAFRLRRADGQTLYAGGSFRRPGGAPRIDAAMAVRFTPKRFWTSPHSAARYPVQWAIETSSGSFEVRALLDDQELDSRASTGAIYWEGLSELLDAGGRRIGLGYLEMTGYAAALRL